MVGRAKVYLYMVSICIYRTLYSDGSAGSFSTHAAPAYYFQAR